MGRGWGRVYARALERQGIEHWVSGRGWKPDCDGLIVASSSESHFEVAHKALSAGIPVLVEKPVCLKSEDVEHLIDLGGIAMAGHTRLYDPAWADFKAGLVASSARAYAGGVTASNPDAEWNWLPHMVSMAIDCGIDPEKCRFVVTEERQSLRFIAGGREFRDTKNAVDGLVREFVRAIERGDPNNEGLRLGLQTVRYVEKHKAALRGRFSFRS